MLVSLHEMTGSTGLVSSKSLCSVTHYSFNLVLSQHPGCSVVEGAGSHRSHSLCLHCGRG